MPFKISTSAMPRAWLFAVGAMLCVPSSRAHARVCPAAESLPQLTIDRIENPAIPVFDKWQVFLDGVAVSDMQVAQWARNDRMIDVASEEMKDRGTYVYLGLGGVALGTAVSSVGWVLFGQDQIPQRDSLSLALGGLLLGVAGMLFVTDSIQSPLEPHLAPTPDHRLTRAQMQRLVAQINGRIFQAACADAHSASHSTKTQAKTQEP